MKDIIKKTLKFFSFKRKKSARIARERLKIVVSHQRSAESNPEFISELRKDLLNVLSRYITVDPEQINVNLEKVGNRSILELNVAIPDNAKK